MGEQSSYTHQMAYIHTISHFHTEQNEVKLKLSHLRDSMFRDGVRLEQESSGAEMELIFKFNLSRTWRSEKIHQTLSVIHLNYYALKNIGSLSLQQPDLSHELLHVIFPLENKCPKIVKWDMGFHIFCKTMILYIDLQVKDRISLNIFPIILL